MLKKILRIGASIIDKGRLKNRDFTIIANNCWAGYVYQEMGLQYLTPTVGLFIHAPCFLRFVSDLKGYFNKDIAFIEESRYELINENRKSGVFKQYPIGLLGTDVEVHFIHYTNISEAEKKWSRRIKRINWDNLFVEFCDRDACTPNHLEEFDTLPFTNKICFTSKNYSHLKSAIWIKEYEDVPFVGTDLYNICKKYIDIIEWLNSGNVHISNLRQSINRFLYK